MRDSVIFATIVLAISCTSKVNLVPETPSDAPDYLCTWNLQGYVCSYGPPEEMRAQMTERYLFGNGPFEGWTSLYPQIRQDLYFVMDDSWDIPADRNERWDNPYYGTARLDLLGVIAPESLLSLRLLKNSSVNAPMVPERSVKPSSMKSLMLSIVRGTPSLRQCVSCSRILDSIALRYSRSGFVLLEFICCWKESGFSLRGR